MTDGGSSARQSAEEAEEQGPEDVLLERGGDLKLRLLSGSTTRIAVELALLQSELHLLSEKLLLRGQERRRCQTIHDAGESGSMHAVLMDFGSAREARMEINSRSEAVQLQEDAEAHCSAPYRLFLLKCLTILQVDSIMDAPPKLFPCQRATSCSLQIQWLS